MRWGLSFSKLISAPTASRRWPVILLSFSFICISTGAQILPNAPGNLTATAGTQTNGVQVSWDSALNASTYEVWRSASDDLASARLVGSLGGSTTFLDLAWPPQTKYYYWIRGKNPNGYGEFAGSISGWRRDVDIGQILWSYPLPVGFANISKLAIDRLGSVYFSGSIPDQSSAGSHTALVKLNPDGTLAWQFSTNNLASMTAINSKGQVYAASIQTLFCLDTNGAPLWSFVAGGNVSADRCALGYDDSIYFFAPYLYAVSGEGTKKWSNPAGDTSGSEPHDLVIGNKGNIVVSRFNLMEFSSDGTSLWNTNITALSGSIALGSDRSIYAWHNPHQQGVNLIGGIMSIALEGGMQWSVDIFDGSVLGVPLVIGKTGTIYGALNDALVAYRQDGTPIWQYYSFDKGEIDGITGSAVVDANDVVYFPTTSGIKAVKNKNIQFTVKAGMASSPILTEDRILYFSTDNAIKAVRVSDPPAMTGWPMVAGDAQGTSRLKFPASWTATKGESLQMRAVVGTPAILEIQSSLDFHVWESVTNIIAAEGTVTFTPQLKELTNVFFRSISR